MPRTRRDTSAKLRLKCDDAEDTFIASYSNMGEPFREGINIGVSNTEYDKSVTVMLNDFEAKQLRDMLLSHYPLND